MGIIISHYKDPYQPISIMECHNGFERCLDGFRKMGVSSLINLNSPWSCSFQLEVPFSQFFSGCFPTSTFPKWSCKCSRPSTLSSKLVKLTRHPSQHSAAGGGGSFSPMMGWWKKPKQKNINHQPSTLTLDLYNAGPQGADSSSPPAWRLNFLGAGWIQHQASKQKDGLKIEFFLRMFFSTKTIISSGFGRFLILTISIWTLSTRKLPENPYLGKNSRYLPPVVCIVKTASWFHCKNGKNPSKGQC